jgi:hypothetical protein
MSHAPWHSGGGTYTGAHEDFDANKGYTGSVSQSGNSGGNDYSGDTILEDIDQAQGGLDIDNLVANKDKYQYLYLDPNDPRNEYQKMMHALKTGGTYTSPGGIIPNNLMGLPKGINQGQQIGGMSVTGNEFTQDAYKDKFPNPLVKIAGGIADAYQQFSPMAQIMKGLGNAKTMAKDVTKPVVDTTKDVVESIKEFALSGPNEIVEESETEREFYNLPDSNFNIHTMKKGGIVHAADGVFAESETIEMPLTLPEIKRHRKKLEAGFQYDIEVDGRNQSFSFDEQIGPSGIAALRERENITPFDTGLNMYGGGQFAEGNTPEARQALEVLRSIDPNQPGNFHMQGGTALEYKANGGYMSSFPNQNLNKESLSASDNIDDRIMKNLEFEKMAPGMMGYNMGGVVEPVAPDFTTGI